MPEELMPAPGGHDPKNDLVVPSRVRSLAETLDRDLARRGRTGQLVILETSFAWCYVYAGEWVANCPAKCGNVELMTEKLDRDRGNPKVTGHRKDSFFCSYCMAIYTSVRWPPNADEIMEVLNRRPIPHNRNWYPEGHPTAIEFRIDDGQTIEELIAENSANGID